MGEALLSLGSSTGTVTTPSEDQPRGIHHASPLFPPFIKRAPRRYRARELRNGAKSNFLPMIRCA